MPEIGTSGSMSGDRKRGVAEWPSYRAILNFTISTFATLQYTTSEIDG